MRPLAHWIVGLVAAVAVPVLTAQDEATLSVRESELNKEAVAGMHAAADAFQQQKQHLRALELRREIWLEYDEDDRLARERTGFVQVGKLWRKDAAKLVLDRDLKGKRSKIRRIERDLQKLTKRLLAEHRALAEGFTAIGKPERAARHWKRVLRFAPGDPKAAAALVIREFEGFTGSAHELRMLRRGRAIRGAVDWLNRTEFAVEVLAEERLPLLEAAQVPHLGVRSEHYTVWGSLPQAELITVAMDCERALLLAHALFGVSTGEPFRPRKHRDLVFTSNADEYAAALGVCRDQFDEERFRFLRDEVEQCFVTHESEPLRLHKAHLGLAATRDQAVRGVMQDATGVLADGLYEGVGHLACGLLFGRTLTFLQEQLKERTAASWTKRSLAPDLDVWMQIAQESAWAKSDTRTSELVLIHGARLTNEQRVKAWAICHYFVHWRPEFFFDLDQSRTDDIKTAPDVEAEFLRRAAFELPKVDVDWRAFWARGEALRAAMRRDPLPNEKAKTRAAIERGRATVDAVNAARAAFRVGPVGYFIEDNTDVAAVRRYEKALAKAEREQKKREKQKRAGRKVKPVEMPQLPTSVGRTLMFSRGDDAGAAVAAWLCNPAWRDRLLHPGRDLVSVPSSKGALLLGVAMPAQPATRGLPLAWPRPNQRGVPGRARLGDLGPRARAAFPSVEPDAEVGMPLTLHFARAIDVSLLAHVGCSVFVGNRPLDGSLIAYGEPMGEGDTADLAPGCVAFVPESPLPAGATIEARWRLPAQLLPEGEQFPAWTFFVE